MRNRQKSFVAGLAFVLLVFGSAAAQEAVVYFVRAGEALSLIHI